MEAGDVSDAPWRPSASIPPSKPAHYPRTYRPPNYWISWVAILGLSGVFMGLGDLMQLHTVSTDEPPMTLREDLGWWAQLSWIYLFFHFLGVRPQLRYPSPDLVTVLNPLREITIERHTVRSIDTDVGWARIKLHSGKRILVLALEEWNDADLAPSVQQEMRQMTTSDDTSSPPRDPEGQPRWHLRRFTWEDLVMALILFGYPALGVAVRT